MSLNPKKIQKDFPILKRRVRDGKRLVYLDNAATTQKPIQVIDAMSDFYKQNNANVHRGVHQLSEEATELYETAHKTVSSFIGAEGMEEIVFTKNTTESLNLLAYSLFSTLRKGDEIVLTQMEHHSNLIPWQQLSKQKGIKVRFVPLSKENYSLDLSGIDSIITKKTKIVSLSHVSNTLGTINDVSKISKIAHENNALCVLDSAQAASHFKMNVEKLGCDFLAFSSHKMMGPTGIGVLYGKEALLSSMPPFLYGGGMISRVDFEDTSFSDLPWKFEAGTPSACEAVGLSSAIDYLSSIRMEKVERYERDLTAYAKKEISSIKGVTTYFPKKSAGVFSFNVNGVHAHDVSSILDMEGVAIRGGHHCTMPLMSLLDLSGTARASISVYNTKEDIDALTKGIEKVKKVFS